MYVCVYVCVGGTGTGGRDIQTLAKLSIGEGGCDKKVMQRVGLKSRKGILKLPAMLDGPFPTRHKMAGASQFPEHLTSA